MTHVSPVFTEYEQQVVRELAVHRVQPNAIHRLLESVGKPMVKLMNLGRTSQNRTVRSLSDHLHGWIEEGLIKTFRAANRLANSKDIAKRYAAWLASSVASRAIKERGCPHPRERKRG